MLVSSLTNMAGCFEPGFSGVVLVRDSYEATTALCGTISCAIESSLIFTW